MERLTEAIVMQNQRQHQVAGYLGVNVLFNVWENHRTAPQMVGIHNHCNDHRTVRNRLCRASLWVCCDCVDLLLIRARRSLLSVTTSSDSPAR